MFLYIYRRDERNIKMSFGFPSFYNSTTTTFSSTNTFSPFMNYSTTSISCFNFPGMAMYNDNSSGTIQDWQNIGSNFGEALSMPFTKLFSALG